MIRRMKRGLRDCFYFQHFAYISHYYYTGNQKFVYQYKSNRTVQLIFKRHVLALCLALRNMMIEEGTFSFLLKVIFHTRGIQTLGLQWHYLALRFHHVQSDLWWLQGAWAQFHGATVFITLFPENRFSNKTQRFCLGWLRLKCNFCFQPRVPVSPSTPPKK